MMQLTNWKVAFAFLIINIFLSLILVTESYNHGPVHLDEHIVSIVRDDGRNCSGVIVSSHDVLTTVNCSQGPKDRMLIRAGSNYRYYGGSIHHIENVTVHERFRVSNVPLHDLALIRVREAFNTTKARPVKLLHHALEANSTAYEAKWSPQAYNHEVLKFSEVPIVNQSKCNQEYWSYGGLHEGHICTAKNVTMYQPCSDNSGVPLFFNGTLAGIFSFSQGCHSDKPAVYTEVAYYWDWIHRRLFHEKRNATGHKSHFPFNPMGHMGSMIPGLNQFHNPMNQPQHPNEPNSHPQDNNKPFSNIMGKLGPNLMNPGLMNKSSNTKNGKSSSNMIIAGSIVSYVVPTLVMLILSK